MATTSSSPKSFHIFEKDLDESTYNRFSMQNMLAVDTEAMGLIHGRDRLCLVQISDKEDNVVCIKIENE